MENAEFIELLRSHTALIHRIAGAYGRDSADKNDVAQEIIVQLWRSRARYDPRFALSTWIYRIAFNVAISWTRREQRHRRAEPLDAHLLTLTHSPPDAPHEDIMTLHACIAEFDELSRALVLLYLDGNDHHTIASVLGLSTTNVATKLSRIRTKLRERLSATIDAIRHDPKEQDYGTR